MLGNFTYCNPTRLYDQVVSILKDCGKEVFRMETTWSYSPDFLMEPPP